MVDYVFENKLPTGFLSVSRGPEKCKQSFRFSFFFQGEEKKFYLRIESNFIIKEINFLKTIKLLLGYLEKAS